MSESSAGRRGPGVRARLFIASALTAVAGLAAFAGAAQAEQLKFTFDEGRANLGSQKGVHMIDSSIPDPPATLTVHYDPGTGAFDAPATGLVFPSKTIEDIDTGLIGFVDARADISAIGSVAGTYNQATGALDTTAMNIKAVINVYTADAAQTEDNLLTRCEISPVPLQLDSTGSLVDNTNPMSPVNYNGAAFVPGPGAGVGLWSSLPPSTNTAGAPICGFVDPLLAGPGGIWLQGTTPTVGPDPPPANPGGGGNGGAAGVVSTPCKKGFKKVKGKCKKAKKKKKKKK